MQRSCAPHFLHNHTYLLSISSYSPAFKHAEVINNNNSKFPSKHSCSVCSSNYHPASFHPHNPTLELSLSATFIPSFPLLCSLMPFLSLSSSPPSQEFSCEGHRSTQGCSLHVQSHLLHYKWPAFKIKLLFSGYHNVLISSPFMPSASLWVLLSKAHSLTQLHLSKNFFGCWLHPNSDVMRCEIRLFLLFGDCSSSFNPKDNMS